MLLFPKTPRQLAEEQPEASWILEPWIPSQALVTLSGMAKASGKTTFALAMCRSICTGAPFLEKNPLKGSVLYLSEQAPRSLCQALTEAQLEDVENLHFVLWADLIGHEWKDVANAAIDLAKELGCLMIVIDTFPQFALADGASENDAHAVRTACKPLLKGIRDHRIAILVVVHTRKAGGGPGDGIRGSNFLAGAADILITLKRAAGGNSSNVRLLNTLARFPETPENSRIVLDKNNGDYFYSDANTRKAKARRVVKKRKAAAFKVQMLEVFSQDARVWTKNTLEAELGCSRVTLNRVLEQLAHEGLIRPLHPEKGSNAKRYQGIREVGNALEALEEMEGTEPMEPAEDD